MLDSSRYEYLPLPPTCHMSRLIGQKIHLQDSTPVNPRQVLINNFNWRKDAFLLFLPKLSDFPTWSVIQRFQSYLAEIASNIEYVCISYGLFIPVTEVTQLQRADLTFWMGIRSNTFLEEGFDICGQHNNNSYFCQDCVNNIWRSKPPQFGYINCINSYTY